MLLWCTKCQAKETEIEDFVCANDLREHSMMAAEA